MEPLILSRTSRGYGIIELISRAGSPSMSNEHIRAPSHPDGGAADWLGL